MAKILTSNKNYYDIADTIRQMKNVNTTYKPREMASALKDIYSNEVEGVPPLSFESNGMPLIDYRIDGASGGVGDRTKNLFNFNGWSENLSVSGNNELIINNDSITITAVSNDAFTIPYYASHPNIYRIDVLPNSQYVLSWDSNNTLPGRIYVFKNGLLGSENFVQVDNASKKYITFSTDGNTTFITIRFGVMNAGDSITYSHIQLEEGSTVTDYEPYGYKVPVVVSGKNLAKWDTHLQPQTNGIVLNDLNSISSIINVSNINNIYIFGDKTKINSNVYRIGKSNEPISLNSQTTRINYGGGILDTSDCNYVVISCSIYNTETTFDEIKNSFMIVEGTTSPENFEPYHESTTTNIYLDKPIEAKANIPSEYTEVEYIESTGTQYIDTNIIPTNTTGVEAKITICNDNNRDNIFMGCRDTANGETRYWIDVDWTGNDKIIFGFNGNTAANDRYSLKDSDVGKSFIISMNYMNDRTGKINGITYDTSISSKTLVSISNSIYIFAGNRSGTAAYQYSGKLYNLKITDGTNVIKNFVPCYRNSDNVAGLYDLVNNVFYTNQGTGNFIVGSIKENESISLSDTNTNIPTIEGTNVLTIDTTVQPSNVYVQAPKDTDEIVYLTTILEEEI